MVEVFGGMSEWIDVVLVEEVLVGEGCEYVVGECILVVFYIWDGWYVIDGICLYYGGLFG